MEIPDWTRNWTGFITRNLHAHTPSGLKEADGPEWTDYMWEIWLNNSDHGQKLKAENDNTRKNETERSPSSPTRTPTRNRTPNQ